MQFTPLGALRPESIPTLPPEALEATKNRLQSTLERLGELHDQMAFRHALLTSALSRAEGLQAGIIAYLDAITPDADLEPSLGFLEAVGSPLGYRHGDQTNASEGATDDREDDWEEGERTMGWESHGAQINLSRGSDDCEPALGWPERIDQTRDRRSRADHEDEPTMGSSLFWDQDYWAAGYDSTDSEREDVTEGEGDPCADDREDATDWGYCTWAEEGDQTVLRHHEITPGRGPRRPFGFYGHVDHVAAAARQVRALKRQKRARK